MIGRPSSFTEVRTVNDKATRYASADKRRYLRSALDRPGRVRFDARPIGGSSDSDYVRELENPRERFATACDPIRSDDGHHGLCLSPETQQVLKSQRSPLCATSLCVGEPVESLGSEPVEVENRNLISRALFP